jgi:hypothetical protein
MSRHRGHFFAEDMLVAAHAELHDLNHGGGGPLVAIGQRTYPYEAPVPYRSLRPLRCAYPHCVHEAPGRCTT